MFRSKFFIIMTIGIIVFQANTKAKSCEFDISHDHLETFICGSNNANLVRVKIESISNCEVVFRIAPINIWKDCNAAIGDTFDYDGTYYIYEGYPSTFNPPIKYVPFNKNDTYVDVNVSLDYLSEMRSFYVAGLKDDEFFYTDPIDITPITPQKGDLEVWIKPNQAIQNGAKWKLFQYTNWIDGNVRLKGINAGNYIIQFSDIPGWIKPSDIDVNIIAGNVAYKEGTYFDNRKYSVSGNIVDHNNNGIYNVTVTYANNYSDKTDYDGNFIITNIPAGTSGYLMPSHSEYTFIPEKQFIVSLYSDASHKNFTTESPSPTVSYNQPNTGSFYVGESITINWNSTNQHHFGLYLYKGGTSEDQQVGTIVLTPQSDYTYYIWQIPSHINDDNNNSHTIDGNDYKIKVAIWNGNTSDAISSGDFCDYFISIFPKNDALSIESEIVSPVKGNSETFFTYNASVFNETGNTSMSVFITDPNGTEQEYIMEYIPNSNPTRFSKCIQLLASGSYFYRYKAVDAYTTKWHPDSGKIVGPTVYEEHILEIDKFDVTPSYALAGNEITYFAQIQNEVGIATMSVFVTSPDGIEKEYIMIYNKDSSPTSFSKKIVLSSPGEYSYRFKATDDNYTIWEPKSGKNLGPSITSLEPIINLSSSVDSGKAPLYVDFTAKSQNVFVRNFEWDYSNDNIIDTITLDGKSSYTFTDPGDYNTCVKINDLSGHQYKKCKTISIIESDPISNELVFTPYYPENDAIPSSAMRGGKAKRYYIIKTFDDNKSLINKIIYYTYDGVDTIYETQTDMFGIAYIETPELTHSQHYELIMTNIDGDKLAVQPDFSPSFNVIVREKSYSTEHSIFFHYGQSFGFGGPGFKIGPFALKTMEASLNTGKNITSTLKFNIKETRSDLFLTNTRGGDIGGDFFLGLFGKTWSTTTSKPSIKVGAQFEPNIKESYKSKYRFHNYSYDSHKYQIAILILENIFLSSFNNLMVRDLINELLLNDEQYKESIGFQVDLEGRPFMGASFELINPLRIIPGNSINFEIFKREHEFLYRFDIESFFNGTQKICQGYVHNYDVSNLNLDIKNKFNGDKRKNSTPALAWKDFLNFGNHKEKIGEHDICVQTNKNGTRMIEMSQLLYRNSDSYLLSSDVYETYRKVKTGHSDSISDLIQKSSMIENMFNKGISYGITSESYKKAFSSFFSIERGFAECENIKKMIQLREFPLDIEFSGGFKVGLNLKFAYKKVIEYIVNKHIFIPKKYLLEIEEYPDDYISDDIFFLDETIKPVIKQIILNISDRFDSNLIKIIDDTVFFIETGGGLLKGFLNPNKASKAVLTRFSNDNKKKSNKIAAKNSRSQTYQTQTIGDSYIVNIIDNINNEVSTFSPIELTLKYTRKQLTDAGFSISDSNKLRIYHWNGQTRYYHSIGCTVNQDLQSVTSSITLPGQYILAIDQSSPEIKNFKISDRTNKPTISFQIDDDLSGIDIDRLQLYINNTEIINNLNINDYFDYSTGKFCYAIDNALSSGEHTIKIVVYDSSENKKEFFQNFTVNAIVPIIQHSFVTNANSNTPLIIHANVTDDEHLNGVFLCYRPKTEETPFQTLEMKSSNSTSSEYTQTIPKKHMTSSGIRYFIQAFDVSGNETRSPLCNIAIEDGVAPAIGTPEITLISNGYKIEWEQTEDIDTAGYRIYLGKTVDNLELFDDIQDDASSIIIHELNDNSFISIAAYDEIGNESEKSNPQAIKAIKTQKIPLDSGWNLISLNVQIDDQRPEEVFNSIFSQLTKVKTISKSYDPFVPSFLNNLNTIIPEQGYWLSIEHNIDLFVTGIPLNISSSYIRLNKGWNLVGYHCQYSQSVDQALKGIMDVLVKVKSINQSFDPNIPLFLNTLKELEPNYGYWIKVSSDAILSYQ